MPAQIQRGVAATTSARSSGSEQGPHRSNAGVRWKRPLTVKPAEHRGFDRSTRYFTRRKPSVGISPGARAASPPLRGLSLAEDPFTRAVERASSCVDHAQRPMPPTELSPANPPLSEPRHLQKSPSHVGWNEPAPAQATHGGKPPDHGAAMHGAAMLRRGTTNDAAGRRWHNESMSSHGPRGRHHTRQHRGSRHDQLADDLQEFS